MACKIIPRDTLDIVHQGHWDTLEKGQREGAHQVGHLFNLPYRYRYLVMFMCARQYQKLGIQK